MRKPVLHKPAVRRKQSQAKQNICWVRMLKKGAAFVGSNALTTLGITMAIGTGGVAAGAGFINSAVNLGFGVSAVTGSVLTIKNKKVITQEGAA